MRKVLIGTLLALALAVTPALAQQQGQPQQQQPQIELQDGELQQFVAVLESVRQVQSQAQQDMQSSLEDEGMSQQRFSEIHRQKQQSGGSGSGSGSGNISQQEEQQYQAILSELQEIRQQTSQEIQQVIQDEGFSMQRFNQIYRAVQSRPQLQQRVQNMMSSSGSGSGSGSGS